MASYIGVALAILSGVLNGSFAVPMKRTIKWEWENTWLVYAITALIFYPLIITGLTVPELFSIYHQTPLNILLRTFLFGAGWGIGSVMFGLGLFMLGLSLGYTIMIGVIAVAGALVPMLVHHPGSLFTRAGLIIIFSMFVTVLGVARCGLAGKIREQGSALKNEKKKTPKSFGKGIFVCVCAGILSSMLNFAFDFGRPIITIARDTLTGSATDFQLNHCVWFITLFGGFLPFLFYCGYLLIKNHSLKKYLVPGSSRHWFWAFLMGTLWTGGIILYGIGASNLGKLGTTIGWLILMAVTVLAGNLWGILTGEWKVAPRKAKIYMLQGLLLLLFSVAVVGFGKLLLP